jgi:hypothetical protein
MLKEKNLGKFSKNYGTFTQKVVTKLSKYGFGIPDPGVKKAPNPGSRIRNTVYNYGHCLCTVMLMTGTCAGVLGASYQAIIRVNMSQHVCPFSFTLICVLPSPLPPPPSPPTPPCLLTDVQRQNSWT